MEKAKTIRGGWTVRYRDPRGRLRSKTFDRKVDATRFSSTVEADIVRGDWLDPAAGRESCGDWCDKWLASRAHVKPKTLAGYESIIGNHVRPRLGSVRIRDVDHPTVLAFLAQLSSEGAAPNTVRNARNVLRSVLDLAVRSGALRVNPVTGARVQPGPSDEMHFLTAGQVFDLAAAVTDPEDRAGHFPEYGLLVRVAGWTGLRAGELAALRVARVNPLRGEVEVAESVAEVHGALVYGETKTYARRTVPVPRALADEFTAHVAGRDPSELVFRAPKGGPVRHSLFYRRHFSPALAQARLPASVRFHDLRHTAAALMVAEGAHALAVSRRLGHSSISVTFDTYGHLFPDREEALTEALDSTYRAAASRLLREECAKVGS
jgi:integrase